MASPALPDARDAAGEGQTSAAQAAVVAAARPISTYVRQWDRGQMDPDGPSSLAEATAFAVRPEARAQLLRFLASPNALLQLRHPDPAALRGAAALLARRLGAAAPPRLARYYCRRLPSPRTMESVDAAVLDLVYCLAGQLVGLYALRTDDDALPSDTRRAREALAALDGTMATWYPALTALEEALRLAGPGITVIVDQLDLLQGQANTVHHLDVYHITQILLSRQGIRVLLTASERGNTSTLSLFDRGERVKFVLSPGTMEKMFKRHPRMCDLGFW